MDLGLARKRALVMGASTGIGRGIAEALAAEGAVVGLCARNAERLAQAAAAIPRAIAFPCDLSKPAAGAELVRAVEAKLGGVDVLVTNTGGPPKGDFLQVSTEQWQAGFQGLFLSAAEAIRAALPGMMERKWGRIILVTSLSAREPIPGLTISNAIRAGLAGLANSVSREAAPHGVTINILMPGYTNTDRLRELGRNLDQLAETIPARRLGRPDELGALTAFLASEQAGYITGQAIAVDGGMLRSI